MHQSGREESIIGTLIDSTLLAIWTGSGSASASGSGSAGTVGNIGIN